MKAERYERASCLSGICWGAVALVIGIVVDISVKDIWAGLVASPLIGLAAGATIRPAHRWSTVPRISAYVATLPAAVYVFGFLSIAGHWIVSSEPFSGVGLLSAPLAYVLGVFAMPFWIGLVPLAILTNLLLAEIDRTS